MKQNMKKKKKENSTLDQKSIVKEFNDDAEDKALLTAELSSLTNLKEKSKKKQSGGFQAMGLSYNVLGGILKKGYKVPTPIQRKSIPVILEGKDVVAMARTGSGKTGAFLIPMFEKLKTRTAKSGARALIFSPTRELALQTMRFTKELGKRTGLKSILVLGGEKMENQFAAIHESPDIIIATPGRFLHLVMEMDLKLSSVEYVVFDEADRLFEMGFQEQLQEVLNRLPEHRQTLLFSATLPSLLVDFVKAGLTDPVLIRLDVELKLSENLKTVYLACRPSDKTAILLHLLKNVVNMAKELTVVFLATKHHIEYVKDVLIKASIPCSYIYSSLDQTARRLNVEQFRAHKVGVLLVTDIAARGIDIPLLDNVINYNFPAKPKLFVHRVGRVARAGRKGIAYTFVAPDEAPYLLDLHLFLGKPVILSQPGILDQDGICGGVPQSAIDDEVDVLQRYHECSIDLEDMTKVCNNAYKKYIKSRPAPSSESIKRVKELSLNTIKVHPIFHENSDEIERTKFLTDMKNYRPNTTIFEVGATAKNQATVIMRQKRHYHSVVDRIRSFQNGLQTSITKDTEELNSGKPLLAAEDTEIQNTFTTILGSRKSKQFNSEKKRQDKYRDAENYLSYKSSEHYTEKGLGVETNFEQQASSAVLDLTADDAQTAMKLKNVSRWDRKRKRFVKDDGSEMKKKMKTESGVWIPKTYKSGIYQKWQENNKIEFQENQNENDSDEADSQFGKLRKGMGGKINAKNQVQNKSRRPPKREMKTKEEILKVRKRKARLMAHQKKRHAERAKKRSASKRKK